MTPHQPDQSSGEPSVPIRADGRATTGRQGQRSRWAQWVPILAWGPRYGRDHARGDIAAGLTVAVMLIPQGLAYAALAGMPPISGLYAAIVGITVYALLGTSGSLAIGPVAITSLMTVNGLARIVSPDDPSYPATAALLALMVGVVLMVLGVARLGVLVNLLSHPVISGFTSAAAIVIALSQLKDVLGLDIGRPDGAMATIRAISATLDEANTATILIAMASITVLLLGRRYARRMPTALLVVIIAIVGTWAFDLAAHGVAVLGDVPSGLPTPVIPTMSADLIGDLFPVALTIGIVAFAEGVSVAKAIARKTRDTIEPNQELIATGAANMAAGLFSGFPIAGGFSRTAVNYDAGARTPFASLVTAGVLAIAVLWMTPLFYYLPTAVLAAIVIVAVLGLVDIGDAVQTLRINRIDGATLLVTFIVTLLIGIEPGLIVGVVVSLAAFVWRSANPHATELGRVNGTDQYRNVDRWPTQVSPDHVILRIDGPLFFANTRRLDEHVRAMIDQRPQVRSVILDASAITDIDTSGVHALADLDADLRAAGIALHLTTVRGPIRDALARAEIWGRFDGRVHASVGTACQTICPHSPLGCRQPGEEPVTIPVL